MIQRIQTLFLLLVLLLSALLLRGELLGLSTGSSMLTIGFPGVSDSGGMILQQLWPLRIIMALVPLLTLVAILLYRRRTTQMRVVMMVLLLSLGIIILGSFYVLMLSRKIEFTVVWRVRAIFPLLMAILSWLAYRAILKDELLVKSYDRLR